MQQTVPLPSLSFSDIIPTSYVRTTGANTENQQSAHYERY
jgi:hypothetical protein